MWKRRYRSTHSLSEHDFEMGDQHQISITFSTWRNSLGDTQKILLFWGTLNFISPIPLPVSQSVLSYSGSHRVNPSNYKNTLPKVTYIRLPLTGHLCSLGKSPTLLYLRHIKMIADCLNKPHPPLDMEKTF